MAEQEQDAIFSRYGLKFNPFPPAATGVAIVRNLWLPDSWKQDLTQRYLQLAASRGDRAMAIVGAYGSGKTYALSWIAEQLLRDDGWQTFKFDNPGLAFYDLANRLLRRVGRYELAKGLWELLSAQNPELKGNSGQLISPSFSDWLALVKTRTARDQFLPRLTGAIKSASLTDDEEIAHRVARIIVETGDRPYFEYRDFVAGRPGSLVAEQEEAAYFKTLIRMLDGVYGGKGVAFLIDEFEDVALQKRLNRKQSHEYMATLRRLLDATNQENFLVIVSMTPEAYVQTISIDPSLEQRFVSPWRVPELTGNDAGRLVQHRLEEAREEPRDGLWPFADNALDGIGPTTVSSPRRLIRVFWQALATAVQTNTDPPISDDDLRLAEQAAYPASA